MGSELSAVELKVLKATPKYDSAAMGPNNIGQQVWPPKHKAMTNCSAPYARVAGRFLNKLCAKGLVHRTGELGFWARTMKGDAYVRDRSE